MIDWLILALVIWYSIAGALTAALNETSPESEHLQSMIYAALWPAMLLLFPFALAGRWSYRRRAKRGVKK